ncbi:MAG: TrkA C-terminal domain-containing protein [Oscillospiraceae bacterium]
MDAGIPDDVLVVMIKRGDGMVVPKGSTRILAGDVLVLCSGRKNAGSRLPDESAPTPSPDPPAAQESASTIALQQD